MNTLQPQHKTIANNTITAATARAAVKPTESNKLNAAVAKVQAAVNANKNPAVVARAHWRTLCRALGKSYLLPIVNH